MWQHWSHLPLVYVLFVRKPQRQQIQTNRTTLPIPAMTSPTVTVLDNGAYSAKIGTSALKQPKIIPNCIMKAKSERRRPFVGDQIDECRDASGLFFILAYQRGYLVNWDVQKTLWDHMFSADCTATNFSDPLIITEPQFNFPSIQEAITEIFFEEYECERLVRTTAADLSAHLLLETTAASAVTAQRCCVVVDMGYSFTHIVPFVQGRRVRSAIRRIDVGGKLLTNHLKEIISYRQLNVMDESYVINQAKEDVCFVSQDFAADMRVAKLRGAANTIVRDYVLPDFTTVRRGYVRDTAVAADADQQLLRLANERFVIPEILFHPSDVGVRQMGVSEAIVHAINACRPEAAVHLYANVVVTGGCAAFAGMRDRVERELRTMAPDEMEVRVSVPQNPVTYAWEGGVKFSQSAQFAKACMTREEYEEEGVRGSIERFDV